MMNRATSNLTLAVVSALVALALGASKGPARMADTRAVEDAGEVRLEKVLVVGISDDRDIRNRFEDRFTTHFRGRGIDAKASYTIVPDLTRLEDREKILSAIYDEGVDAVVTVRAVRIPRGGEDDWIAGWERWVSTGSTVRELIENTLPIAGKETKRYGVEFAFWELAGPRRLWAARTDVMSRRRLDRDAGDLLQAAIADLRDQRWL
jgi:hypothetical protein